MYELHTRGCEPWLGRHVGFIPDRSSGNVTLPCLYIHNTTLKPGLDRNHVFMLMAASQEGTERDI
jgi:hypothetical protein